MAFPKIGGVDPRVPGQNQMNWSAEIDDWSGKAEERLAEKELHRFSASPLLRFSASPLLRFSASPLLSFISTPEILSFWFRLCVRHIINRISLGCLEV